MMAPLGSEVEEHLEAEEPAAGGLAAASWRWTMIRGVQTRSRSFAASRFGVGAKGSDHLKGKLS